MVQKEVKRKTKQYAVAAVLSAIVLVSMVYVFGVAPIVFPSQAPFAGAMKTFSSTQEIVNYLNSNSGSGTVFGGGPLDNKFFGEPAPMPAPVTQGSNTLGIGSDGYTPQYAGVGPVESFSTTNVQVEGVDEADTVKTDGHYIYTASTSQNSNFMYGAFSSYQVNAVYILDATPTDAKVVSKISLGNETEPAGLFLSSDGNKLVVLASKYQLYAFGAERGDDMTPMLRAYSSNVYTYINVYDVSDKADPILTRNLTVSGSYFNSRMIGNDVYAVVSQPAVVYNNLVTLPAVYGSQNAEAVASPSSIYYADSNDTSFTFTSFYGIDIADDSTQSTNMTVMMGGASTMYVSSNNMYITYPDYDQNSGSYTKIYQVAINGLQLSLQAEGSVPGNTINQYAMDEYNGYFRIATNWYGTDGQFNNVYVLDPDLNVTGKLEGLAPNENLHSVRFMGDKCYLVTFLQTDPLFVVDLSQPSSPKVLGELKIPGYSDYLHPYDETHLIGVGKDAADSDRTNFAWYQGLKISLFDVSNVNNPAQLANYSIGDRGTDSPVLSDPKAFLFDKSQNLLVIPVSLALVSEADKQQYGASAYGQTVWQGAYVFSISVEGGLTLRGTITHLDPSLLGNNGYLRNSYDYYGTQNDWVTRALYIGNTLYTVSNAEVKLNNLSDLSTVTTVTLN
jgi:inhibitor of cysteine peptidase